MTGGPDQGTPAFFRKEWIQAFAFLSPVPVFRMKIFL